MRPAVYIRGQAASCAAGTGPDGIVECLRQRACPVGQVILEELSPASLKPFYLAPAEGRSNHPASGSRDEFYRPLFDTAERALRDARISDDERQDLALFLGSTALDIPVYESVCSTARTDISGLLARTTTGYGRMAEDLSAHLGARGPCCTFTTACTSSANALLYAVEMIRNGRLQRALVIGVESFSHLGLYGFESLGLIANAPASTANCLPQGMIVGEGSGAVVLDSRRGDRVDFAIYGGANCCDPHGVTTHGEEGTVIAEVMCKAMAAAGVSPREITAVKVHATGNPANDRAESNGLRTVFGRHMPPLTGLKPFVGHTLGACGVIELILLAEAVGRGFVPGVPRSATVLPEMPTVLSDRHLPVNGGFFLINHFGFGGNCTALVAGSGE